LFDSIVISRIFGGTRIDEEEEEKKTTTTTE
jgi:hypothetical protein